MSGARASLGMYDAPALHMANDALWAGIAAGLRARGMADVPDRLDRHAPLAELWDDPKLVLAQTCGYPFVTRWRGRLRYVATLRYTAAGCEGARHRSRIVVRRDDPAADLAACRGYRVAANEPGSNTGTNLLRAAIVPMARGGRFFGSVIETGSHRASAISVSTGGADIAAIDCVTFAQLARHEPASVSGLRTLAWSASVPGLPLVTSVDTPEEGVGMLRAALRSAIEDPALAATCDSLMIAGIDVLPPGSYEEVAALASGAVAAGYPVLA